MSFKSVYFVYQHQPPHITTKYDVFTSNIMTKETTKSSSFFKNDYV
jgi:hypothetical protein